MKKTPVAAISENLVKPIVEKPVKFKVRAVVTVRKKHKEDLRETIVKHLDALSDKIGRNVVLELVSIDIDPSKTLEKKKKTLLFTHVFCSSPCFRFKSFTMCLGFGMTMVFVFWELTVTNFRHLQSLEFCIFL